MRKPTIIIGKKHIIVACLTLILGVAVYMNYAFASVEDEITADSVAASETVDVANYGDATFVSAEGENDYFAQVRLAKMTSRDEAVETLASILGGGDLSAEENTTYLRCCLVPNSCLTLLHPHGL